MTGYRHGCMQLDGCIYPYDWDVYNWDAVNLEVTAPDDIDPDTLDDVVDAIFRTRDTVRCVWLKDFEPAGCMRDGTPLTRFIYTFEPFRY